MDAVLAGEAGPGEREELDRLCAADPAVREMKESRAALFLSLRRVRTVEPPPDLRESILKAVRLEAVRASPGDEAGQWAGEVSRDRKSGRSEEADVPMGPWARMFNPNRRRSQMPNKKWILGGAAALAVMVAFIALRSPNTGTNAQGTIGAASRYQSEQVSGADVSLDNPEVAAFLQSDTFRKLASSPSFREAAKSTDFGRFVANDNLRGVSAKYDLVRVFESAHVMDLFKSDAFAKAMTEALIADGLRKADLAKMMEGAYLADLLKLDAVRSLASTGDFIKLANDAARVDARSVVDLNRIADGYKGLKESDAYRALEGNKYFAEALQHGFMDLFRTPEGAVFAVDGLRSLVDAGHLAEALRVDGFRSVMDALNVDTYSAVVDLARSPDMLSVLSDAGYRDAAKFPELGRVADAGFVDALARVTE